MRSESLVIRHTSLSNRHSSFDMNSSDSQPQSDVWSDWLLHIRHGDDPGHERALHVELKHHVDRVLDGARLAPGMTLADIGAGDGLIGLSAIDRIGPSLRVLLTDISAPLLRHAEALAVQRNIQDQCVFIQGSAESLDGIEDGAVDAGFANIHLMRTILRLIICRPTTLYQRLLCIDSSRLEGG